MTRALRLSDQDDVVVMIDPAEKGACVLGVTSRDAVPGGHKMAIRTIPAGSYVHKYGQVIGIASREILAGEHVHGHNLVLDENGFRAGGASASAMVRPVSAGGGRSSFMGFARADGGIGTRNVIGIISSVNCSATVARRIARHFEERDLPGIDAVVPLTHSSGCGMAKSGEGIDTLERTLAGYACNPNFGGILMIGLGCEVAQIDAMLDRYGLFPGPRLRKMSIQEEGGTVAAIERGIMFVEELIGIAAGDTRSEQPVSGLVLGLQCGGSDGWSGITANPALGIAADMLVASGGTVLLSETPEIYGAEHLLLARAASGEVADALQARISWWQDYAHRNGASLDNNPSPGNKAGGLTTIYEKSLGAITKAGSSQLNEVLLYGQRRSARGLLFMDSPGYDPCSATGQIASGANILAFTTGRGSVFGSRAAPCLKLASNAALARNLAGDIDLDCSVVLDGMPIAQAGEMIFNALLDTASGGRTKSEQIGVGDFEFVPWQIGAWM